MNALFKTLAAATLAATALVSAPAQAKELKIGIVTPAIIFKDAKISVATSKALNDEFGPREKVINDQIEVFKKKAADLDRDAPTLSADQRTSRQRELGEMDRDIKKLQRDFQADLENRRRTDTQKVLDLVNKVVQRIAKDDKYDFIFQDAVFVTPSANITQKVIAEMDKEAP